MPILPSLISSFSTSIAESVHLWPEGVAVEVYAFMQTDLPTFFNIAQSDARSGQVTVLKTLADNANNQARINDVAERLHLILNGRPVVAFATFFPEVLAHSWNKEVAWMAQNALIFLVRLARRLQQHHNQPVSTVEIVAGSATAGIWTGLELGSEVFVLNRISESQAINRLIKRLRPVVQVAAESPNIRLAVELEPGPLFAVNGRSSLKLLEQYLQKASFPGSHLIGLNLDIPHWSFLSDITVDWLRHPEQAGVLSRIFHAHISDHSIGHISDLPLCSEHDADEYRPWISLLNDLCQSHGTNTPAFSGHISCEIEMYSHLQGVLDSCDTLKTLLPHGNSMSSPS
jgi:sugar phosphate isomerase/epimerase